MAVTDEEMLGVYLNDHLAGAAAGVALARRAARQHSRHRAELTSIAREIVHDRAALVAIMRALGVPTRAYKQYAAWLGEKIGRFKPNGQLVGRSPVSDVLELEALRLGVEGKVAGWRLLRRLADHDDRIDAGFLDELIKRAIRQVEVLEDLRIRTGVEMFSRSVPGQGS